MPSDAEESSPTCNSAELVNRLRYLQAVTSRSHLPISRSAGQQYVMSCQA